MDIPENDPVRMAFMARPELDGLYQEAMRLAEKRRARMTKMGLSAEQQKRVNARALKRLLKH